MDLQAVCGLPVGCSPSATPICMVEDYSGHRGLAVLSGRRRSRINLGRPRVLWREGNFGTQKTEGIRFAEWIITAAATCKQHLLYIVEYITEARHAFLHSLPAPSLLPEPKEILAQTA